MSTQNKFILKLLLFCLLKLVSAEFPFSHDVIPTYIESSVMNIRSKIFPQNLKIELSVWMWSGTLFYSIDSNNNQFLLYSEEELLVVEFRNVAFKKPIHILCNCNGTCSHKHLVLNIRINEEISVSCNNNQVWSPEQISRIPENILNSDYPLFDFGNLLPGESVSAKAWLVNTPHIGNIYPNSHQMAGCIFGVFYNGYELPIETVKPPGMKRICPRVCDEPQICADGLCLETFKVDNPVCDCSAAMGFGEDCRIGKQVARTRFSYQFKCAILKMVWSVKADGYLKLENQNIRIIVEKSKENVNVYFRPSHSIELKVNFTQELSEKSEFYLLFKFSKKAFRVEKSNSSWVADFPVSTEVNNEQFEVIDVDSGGEPMGLGFKRRADSRKWTIVKFPKETRTTLEPPRENNNAGFENETLPELQGIQIIETNSMLKDANKQNSFQDINIITLVLMFIFLATSIGLAIFYLKKMKEIKRIEDQHKNNKILEIQWCSDLVNHGGDLEMVHQNGTKVCNLSRRL